MLDLGIGTIIDCFYVSGNVLLVQIFLYMFSRHLTDSSGSCLRNSCISSGLTADVLDFFMESTNSVRVNGLLNVSELAEIKFIFFFLRVYLILLNCALNWLEEYLENVSARRSAMAFFQLFSGLTWKGVLVGLVVCHQLFSKSRAKLF